MILATLENKARTLFKFRLYKLEINIEGWKGEGRNMKGRCPGVYILELRKCSQTLHK